MHTVIDITRHKRPTLEAGLFHDDGFLDVEPMDFISLTISDDDYSRVLVYLSLEQWEALKNLIPTDKRDV